MKTYNATLRDGSNFKGHKLNLQLFADDPKVDDPKVDDPAGDDPKDPKTFTQAELDKLLQSETDKRVTEALKTSRAKWEEEYKEKLERERKEAERLAKLSAEDKEKELLEKSKREIEERERAIKLKELKLDAIDILAEKKLPIKFADMLIGDNAENTLANIKVFETSWQEAIDLAVKEKLKGATPKAGGSDVVKNPWKDDTFNLTEQGRLLRDDPELAKKLKAEAGK